MGKGVRSYMGDSRGHWEGDTLVVETTNLNNKTGTGGGFFSDAAVLTERFTRTSQERAELRPDGQRSEDVDQAVHHPHAIQRGSSYNDLRVCLPRRQLHDDRRAYRSSRTGEGRREDEGR